MREITVYVGPDLDAEEIKDALNSSGHHGEDDNLLFDVAHALLEHADDRAEIYDVTVTEVSINVEHPSQVEISFETHWGSHWPCRDMNRNETEEECEVATYTEDGDLIFIVPDFRREANPC